MSLLYYQYIIKIICSIINIITLNIYNNYFNIKHFNIIDNKVY